MEGLQNKKSQVIGITLMVVMVVAVISYILRGESLSSIIHAIYFAKWQFVLIAIFFMIFYNLCEGLNIWLILKALNKNTSIWDCIGYGFVGFYFSSITPSSSGGQPAQVYYMKRDGISITLSSLCLMIVLFAHQLVIIVLALLGVLMDTRFTITYRSGFNVLLTFGFLSNGALLLGILLLIFSPKIVYKILNTVGILLFKLRIVKNKEKLNKRIDKSIREYERGAMYMKENPMLIFWVTVVTILQIVAFFMIPYMVYLGFGISEHGLWDIVFTQSILHIAVSSLPLPGAVGASESIFIDMFKGLFGEFVIPGMLLTRLANFYSALVISGIFSLIMYVKKKN